jgi:hypothetical protein
LPDALKERFRNRVPELMDGLFQLTTPNNPPMVRIAAVRELLDRIIGKSTISIEAAHTTVNFGELYRLGMIRAGQAFKRADGATDGGVGAAGDPAENKSDPTK